MAKPKRAAPHVAPPPADARVAPLVVAVLALLAFALLAFGNARTTSATGDEPPHLAAGYTANRLGDFRLNPEHPPLMKRLAALPLLTMNVWPYANGAANGTSAFAAVHEAWAMALAKGQSQWIFAHRWLHGVRDEALARHGATMLTLPTTVPLTRGDFLNDTDSMFLRARTMIILIGIALGVLIFVWSSTLWGRWGGALSVLLFAFDPNFIAHSAVVTTDVGAALFMTAAVYFFWRVCRDGKWIDVAAFSLAFGFAQIAKFSAILLIPIIAILALLRWRRFRVTSIALGAGAVVTVLVIWAAYGFRYSAARDPAAAIAEEYAARATLTQQFLAAPGRETTGQLPIEDAVREWAATKDLISLYPAGPPFEIVSRNMRFTRIPLLGRIILFARDHKLLPEAYLHGLAVMQLDSVWRLGYLNGEYSWSGFRSYYFWTTLYKLTIPALILIACGLVLAFRKRGEWLPFLAWPALVYLATVMFSAFNIGHRHVLPVFPFVYIACGAAVFLLRKRAAAIIAAGLVLAIACNVVFSIPLSPMWNQHLAYLNELAGGPRDSDELADSNIDWSQDLPRLGEWLKKHEIDEPINFVYSGTTEPQYHGIRYINPPLGYFARPEVGMESLRVPGYFAIGANSYRGILYDEARRHFWREYLEKHGTRVGSAGYSIYIYRIESR